jgi:hypothetical protein
MRYFLGALAVGIGAWLVGSWALWLLWIAGALLLVSLIYLWLDASAFQKNNDGTMNTASQWLLAPYLLGAWLNARWWTRHTRAASNVVPGVWIGRLPDNATELPQEIVTVIDLCAELPCQASVPNYVTVPALDLVTLDANQLTAVAALISRSLMKGPIYVCCALGYSRSASAVAAWLIVSGRASSSKDAIAQIRSARPHIVLTQAQSKVLDSLVHTRNA